MTDNLGNSLVSNKFSRDDEQILALNYENLCDAEYLNRLFLPDNPTDQLEINQTQQHKWMLSEDIPEDVILFGNADDLGKEFLFARSLNEVPLEINSHEPLTALVFRQVKVFEHIARLMVTRCSTPKIFIPPEIINPFLDTTSVNVCNQHFASQSLTCVLKVLEKNTHQNLKTSTIEPILSLVIKNFQQLKTIFSESNQNQQPSNLISREHSQLLKSILCNGIINGMASIDTYESDRMKELHEAFNLTLTCSYGLLAIGLYTKDTGNIILAITQLLTINIRIDEKQYDFQSTIHEQPKSNNNNHQLNNNNNNNNGVDYFMNEKLRMKAKLVENKLNNNNNNNNNGNNLSNKYSSHTSLNSLDEGQVRDLQTNDGKLASIKNWDKPHNKPEKDSKTKLQLNRSRPVFEIEDPTASNTNIAISRRVSRPNISQIIDSTNSVKSLGIPILHSAKPPGSENQHNRKSKLIKENLIKIPKSVLKIFRLNNRSDKLVGISISQSSSKCPSEVWSCGQNSYGELGHTDINQRKSFSKINFMDGKNVVSIGAGNEHTVFVTKDGKIFVSGYNDNGQCGVGTMHQVRSPTLVQSLEGEDVAHVHVYNGCEHTLAVTKDGKLYSFGYNYRGQLGLGNTTSEPCPRPVKSLLSRKVVLAGCSYHHSIVLTTEGTLYAFGRNDFGQLGLGDNVDRKTPHLINSSLKDISKLSCGQFHSVLVTKIGRAYACGKNDYGQLGLEGLDTVKTFTKIPGLSESEIIVQVCCGYYHTLLLSQNGVVYCFGRNDYGQLGMGHTQPRIYGCHVIASLRDKNVVSIAAGCYHSVVTTSNGMLYVFGRNNHGQLGTGDTEERHAPHPVDDFIGRKIVAVAAGFYHTVVLSTDTHGAYDDLSDSTSNALLLEHNEKISSATTSSRPNPVALEDKVAANNNDLKFDSPHRTSSVSAPISPDKSNKRLGSRELSFNFTIENKSNITIRELISPLVEQLLQLELSNASTSSSESTDSSLSSISSSSTSTSQPHEISLDWMIKHIRSLAMLLELCRRHVTMSQGIELPFSVEETLKILRSLIAISSTFLHSRRHFLQAKMPFSDTDVNDQVSDEEYNDDNTPVHFPVKSPSIVLLASDIIKEIHQYSSKKSTKTANANSNNGNNSTSETMTQNDDREKTAALKSSLIWLRKEIMHAYFHLTSSFDPAGLVISEASNCLYRSFEYLFPTPRSRYHFFLLLSDNLLKNLTEEAPQNIGTLSALDECSLDYDSTLRLFSKIFFKFRRMTEVMELFKSSNKYGLLIFDKLLSVYSHLSMLCLQNKIRQRDPIQNPHIYHAVAALEHCSANFVKCAIPIILFPTPAHPTSTTKSTTTDRSEKDKNNDFSIQAIGKRIIHQIFESSVEVLDLVTSCQPITDEVTAVLRSGTVLPSVLPTVLLYAISYAQPNEIFLELLPVVRELTRKLQILGHSETAKLSAKAVTATTTAASVVLIKKGTKEESQNEQSTESVPPTSTTAIVSTTTSLAAPASATTSSTTKKDNVIQITWWSRLLKFSVILSARITSNLISSCSLKGPSSSSSALSLPVATSPLQTIVLNHKFWKYCFGPPQLELFHCFEKTIRASNSVSERVRLCCKTLRDRENVFNHTYRVLWQAAKQSNTQNDVEEIECMIMDSVMAVDGNLSLLPCKINSEEACRYRLRPIWSAITNITKSIHSKRSLLVTNSEMSWKSVLNLILQLVTASRVFIVNCIPRMSRVPLPPMRKCRPLLRKYITMIIICARWKACYRLSMKRQGETVVDMVASLLESTLFSVDFLSKKKLIDSWRDLMLSYSKDSECAMKSTTGISVMRDLLKEITFPSMRADIISVLVVAWRTRIQSMLTMRTSTSDTFLNSGYTLHMKFTSNNNRQLFNPYPVCLDGTVMKNRNDYLNQLLLSLEQIVFEFTDPAKDLFSQSGQSELLAVGLAVKFLDLKCVEDDRCVKVIAPSLLLQLQQVLILLDEKLSDIHSNEERAVTKRSQTREKIKNIRRTSSTIITMIQNASVHIAGLGADGRPGIVLQLLGIHAQLLCHFQKSRMAASINQDFDLKMKLSGSSNDIKDKKNKDINNNTAAGAHRRRCQELITRPLQFTRGQEGFAILGEKLMSNYKGVDYTMAMWIFLTKKPTSRYTFITGKITQSDAWPVVVLRGSDSKLDVLYGRSNEFERFTTQAVIPLCVWTHVAVVVEPRKLKIFINGAMDMQVNTPANNRAMMYPVVIGSCPQSMRTRVDHVRDGFEGLLANYKYYTRALSPIHIRVIFDQGQPEAYDFREKWSYQLLSSCKVLVDTLLTLSSSMQNNQYHPNIISAIVSVLRKVADMLHLIFVSDNGRLRNAALKILERILLMDFLDDITFTSNATSTPSTTGTTSSSSTSAFPSHSEVSVVGASFLSEYSSFRERLVLYFMRMIGCCWAPNLAINPDDYSELKPPLSKHQLNDRLIDFFHYSPTFIGERANTYRSSATGGSSSSTSSTASNTSLALDKSVTREELTNELCQLLVGLLRNLASKDRWKDSVSSVIYRSLCKFRSALAESNRREWTSLMVIDILGAAVFLGETPPSAYVGANVEGYFCESVSRVLNVDRITNQATVLSWSNLNSSRQLLVVRTSDLIGHSPDKDTLALRDFVAHSMLDLMDSLKPYVQLLLTDLISVNRPEHPFLRYTLLKSVRPVEVFIFYQIMRHISRSSSIMPTELRVRQGLLQTILQFCVRTLKVQTQAEDSVLDRLIPSLWAKCSKHLSSMTEKVVTGEFPPADGERFFNDYASKYLGIAGDVSHNPQCLKMLKNGLLTELLHCMANQQNDNSTLRPTQEVCIMNDSQTCSDLNDTDAAASLRLIFHLRRGIIQLSRNLLTLPLVDETTFLSLRSPWQMLLWQSVAQIRATQHPVPLGNFMISMCTKLRSAHRSEVTHALTSSLRYASLSFFQSNHSKSVGNVLETTDLFSRLVHAGFSWVNFHINGTNGDTSDIEVCYQFLKLLLPSVSFVDHPMIVLNILQLCRQALHRILVLVLTPPEANKEGSGVEVTKELLDLVRNSNFDVLWTKAQEQLHLEKGSASYRVSAIAQNLTQLAAGFQILQRFAGNPRKLTKVMPNNPLTTYKPNYPKINLVKSTVVEFDLHSCLIRWEGATSTSITGNGLTIEVVLGVIVDGEEDLFETIYRGNCTRLTHGGLSPSCSYIVKCRAIHGAAYSRWSDPIDFATLPGPSFFFDPMKCGPDIKISLDGLAATYNGDDCWSTVLGTEALSCGVSSWELRVASSSTAYIFVGVARSSADLQTFLGGCSNGWGFIGEQALYHNREKVKVYGDAFSVNDVIGVVLDLDNGTLSFTRNGKLLGVAFDKLHGEMFPAIAFYNAGQRIDILANSCQMTCPHEPVPCSITRVNMDDICLSVDLLYSLNCKSLLPYRILEMTADHCTSWCNGDLVRKWATSGKGVFLSTKSKELKKFGFRVNERLRTPYGVATIAGSASGRIWYHMNDNPNVWFFTSQQIHVGREKGHFMRCSYEREAVDVEPKPRNDEDDQMNLTFDALTLQDLLDPKKWSEEMDAALIRFLLKLADMKNILPWDVTTEDVYHNFRTLQHHLTRIVIINADLSRKWGIAGPKRKAVIARLGFLRIMNSLLEHYLQVMSMDSSPDALVMERKAAEEFTPVICTLPSQNDEEHRLPIPMLPAGMHTSRAYGQTVWPIIQLSWAPDEYRRKSFGLLPTTRHRIFTETKMKLFWDILNHTSVRPAKTDDDYDYPDDLPQVRLNRFKSFRAREAAELQKVSGEDLLFSSMFCQLWKELRQHPHDKLRISYTHPMDDGQCRAFKVRFDNEGVDDYGGPYREVFQQLCEELQASDPSQTGNSVSRPSSWSLVVETSSDSLMDAADKPPARCFLPLLYPTPNWTAGECQERYKFIFSPSCTSAVRLDLYRFLGQFIGIAVRSKITLDLSFASIIWKSVVREPLNERDIASFDAPASQFVSHLASLYVRQLAAEDGLEALAEVKEEAQSVLQDLNWTATRSDGVVVELVTGGSKKSVVVDELGYYLKLYVEARLGECSAAIEAFRDGVLSIIPESALSLLTWEELQKVVCGVRKIDVTRLKNNTEYDDDVSVDDFHITAFWEVLEEFTEEEKSSFLRFVWARPTLPPKGVEFPQKLKIQSAVGDDATLKPDQYLPKAHTCFFSLNLPRYTSKEIVADRLRYAIANCTEMDADFRLTDIEVTGWTAIPSQTNWSSMNGSD